MGREESGQKNEMSEDTDGRLWTEMKCLKTRI